MSFYIKGGGGGGQLERMKFEKKIIFFLLNILYMCTDRENVFWF